MTARIEMACAAQDDFPTVMELLVEAANWHQSLGLHQWWPELFTEYLYTRIEDDVANGDVFVARIGREIVGTLTLGWSDESVWGEQEQGAGYVHRFAVTRAWKGHRIGETMLDWAGDHCALAGKPFLRLDTMSSNKKLCTYYERLGFVFQGINLVPRWKPAMYQRPSGHPNPSP